MQVNWSVIGLKLCNQMKIHESNLNRSMQRLSTGLRINSPADDPSGFVISERMKAQISGLDVATHNAQDGISMLQTADGELSSVQEILQRLNELANQSANGTYTETDRKAMSEEFNQLLSEIDGIGNYSEFNTTPLFKDNGTVENKLTLQIGANAGQTLELDIGEMNTSVLGLKDISIATQEEAQKAITAVQGATEKISIQRGKIGAMQNRLEYTVENLENYSENLTDAESRITDADIAKETMEYAKNNILLQVTQSLMAQVKKQEESMIDMLKSMLATDNK